MYFLLKHSIKSYKDNIFVYFIKVSLCLYTGRCMFSCVHNMNLDGPGHLNKSYNVDCLLQKLWKDIVIFKKKP